MRKFEFKSTICILALILVLPFALLFSGCGPTPTNEVNAVHFIGDTTENDKAVFEVDVGKPKTLTYKVNPSSWSGYAVNFDDYADIDNKYNFTLDNSKGIITVNDKKFKPVEVRISINNKVDYCIVRLKEYPASFELESDEISLSSGSVHYLKPKATGYDLNETNFNFRVTSSDETKVEVPDESRLNFVVVGETASSATITVEMLNMDRSEVISKQTIKVNIVEAAADAVIKLQGLQSFVNANETAKIRLSTLRDNDYQIKCLVILMSSSNTIIDSNEKFNIEFSDNEKVSLDENNNTILVNNGVEAGFKFKVTVRAKTLLGENGEKFTCSFYIEIE